MEGLGKGSKSVLGLRRYKFGLGILEAACEGGREALGFRMIL